MKMTRKQFFLTTGAICVTTAIGLISMNVLADTPSRAANLKSKGIFSYGNGQAVIDSSDLTYLADEIDLLEKTYKTKIASSLGNVSTFFDENGDTVRTVPQAEIYDASVMPFSSLTEAISSSQKIYNEGTPYTNESGEQCYKIPDGSITMDGETDGAEAVNISSAYAENLSAGAAAWVDGELIIGNGATNKEYYNLGWLDGQRDIKDNITITYTYHTHKGTEETGGECYKPIYKQHTHISSCYKTVNSSCSCTTDAGKWYGIPGETNYYLRCEACGHAGHGSDRCGAGTTSTSIICGKTAGQRYEDEGIEGYTLCCGKTLDTPETATITFH